MQQNSFVLFAIRNKDWKVRLGLLTIESIRFDWPIIQNLAGSSSAEFYRYFFILLN